jgi:hypothetical protein
MWNQAQAGRYNCLQSAHIKSLQKIGNCQTSNFFAKIALGAFIFLFLQSCTPELYPVKLY